MSLEALELIASILHNLNTRVGYLESNDTGGDNYCDRIQKELDALLEKMKHDSLPKKQTIKAKR